MANQSDIKYYCPECGEELQQGEYSYDYDTANLRVECCPYCGCEGKVVNMGDDEE